MRACESERDGTCDTAPPVRNRPAREDVVPCRSRRGYGPPTALRRPTSASLHYDAVSRRDRESCHHAVKGAVQLGTSHSRQLFCKPRRLRKCVVSISPRLPVGCIFLRRRRKNFFLCQKQNKSYSDKSNDTFLHAASSVADYRSWRRATDVQHPRKPIYQTPRTFTYFALTS